MKSRKLNLEPLPSFDKIQISDAPIQFLKNYNSNQLYILRDDLCHPLVGLENLESQLNGNKWRKLKYNIEAALSSGFDGLLTFGGAFSNHLYAVAAAGKLFGLKTIGIVRGELIEPLNPTLSFCVDCGMELIPVSRSDYRLKENLTYWNALQKRFPSYYLIPEGGTNALALKGVAEIMDLVDDSFDYLVCPLGTGGTFSGLVLGGRNRAFEFVGVPVLKMDFSDRIFELTGMKDGWQIAEDYTFGGYAKFNDALLEFISSIYSSFDLVLDPVYTGKGLYAIDDLLKRDALGSGLKVLYIHTGGLQGVRGFNERFGLGLPS